MALFRNLASMEGLNSALQDGIVPFSADQLPLQVAFSDEIQLSVGLNNIPSFKPVGDFIPSSHGCHSMNMMEIQVNPSPSVSGTTGSFRPTKANTHNRVQNCGGKKRKRVGEVEKAKLRQVVHVRAKRGQATDSHSLAERLRREKINEKLRCLQDLVPGCYKTMGMAVMLDVTINYVRSLQNQIDFLSTKLSAASLFYDFNSSLAEAIETSQGTNGYKAEQGMEKLVGEAYASGESSQFQTLNWPF